MYHNWVVYHKIQTHSFLKVESLGEARCRKSWDQFKGYDPLSPRYVKRVSGKRKDHRWENKCQSSSSGKCLRYEICVDRTPTHNTHLCSTVCSQARTAQLMRLAQELHCHLCALKEVLSSGVFHVLSMVVLSHTFLPTTHREHSVHLAHLQAPSVDKLRHQESLWREDLQSGGNPRTTTPTSADTWTLAEKSKFCGCWHS